MKIKEVTVTKHFKIGLPLYSSCDVGVGMTVEIGENEVVNWNKLWDEVNQQLAIQSNNVDPSWITFDQDSKEWKYTLTIPKADYKK